MPRWIQVRVESEAFSDDIRVREIEGREAISQIFAFDLDVVCDASSGGLDADAVIGAKITIIFERDDGRELRRLHGLIAELHDTLAYDDWRSYRLRVVPHLWLATLVETLEIYMDLSLPDVLRKKLTGMDMVEGEDFELRLMGRYFPREFIVQYMESDLAFISRLTEHFGVSWFFEHKNDRDVVVFTDHNDGFPWIEGDRVPFAPRGEAMSIHGLRATTRLLPKLFVQRDYNYRNPSADLTATSEIPDGWAGGVIEYGGHFKTEEEGHWLASIRAEERRATRHVFEGESVLPQIGAGTRLKLEGHPSGEATLLITEVHHRARQPVLLHGKDDDRDYQGRFSAISTGLRYRPPRRTPKPRVPGVMTAVVDAEQQGPYAEVDDDGRYKVKFLFDTSGPGDGKASRPTRMMQPHSGAGYGFHFPLRPGTEVLITFVNGDPDRPIIAGTVPNPQTPSPVQAENANRNIIRTGGGNEVNFDDTSDGQRIKMTTPHASTSFQLGSPNDPEKGAILTTLGASSTLASTGVSTMTSFNSALTVFKSFNESGAISTVAKKPGPWVGKLAIAKSVVKIVDVLVGLSDVIVQDVQNVYALRKANADAENQRKLAAVDTATNNLVTAQNAELAAKTALLAAFPADPAPPAAQPKAALTALIDAYNAAVKKLADDEKALFTTTKDRDTAQRKGQDGVVAQKNEAIGIAATDPANSTKATRDGQQIDAYGQAQTVALDRWAIDGTEPPAADKKKALDDALQALIDGANANPPTVTAAIGAAALAYKNAVQAARDLVDPLSQANRDQVASQKALDDINYDITTGDTYQNLSYARSALAIAKTGIALFNAVVTLYGFVQDLKTKALEEEAQWLKAIATYTPISPQAAPLAPAVKLEAQVPPETVRHTLGSNGNTTVFGKKRLFLHSPLVVVSGSGDVGDPTADPPKLPDTTGKLVLIAETKTLVLSKDTAEINGEQKTYVASNTAVEILAENKVVPATKATLKAESTGAMTIRSKTRIDVEVDEAASAGVFKLKTCDDQSNRARSGGEEDHPQGPRRPRAQGRQDGEAPRRREQGEPEHGRRQRGRHPPREGGHLAARDDGRQRHQPRQGRRAPPPRQQLRHRRRRQAQRDPGARQVGQPRGRGGRADHGKWEDPARLSSLSRSSIAHRSTFAAASAIAARPTYPR
ncbi:MAG: type VI secretion system tip protein TssI/VgrG [Minicystis sp.]